MLYNIHDSNFSKIIKQLIFWLSLSAMFGLFIFLLKDEVKLPQRQITIDVDIKNKVNICSPNNPKELRQRKLYEF